MNVITRDFYKPNQFVTFPGYEWSGNTPVGGDRNVYFASEGGAITRSSCELLPGQASQFPDSPTAMLLFKNLKQQKSPQPFVFAHVGGRYADLRMHDPDLELAVEIHSDWGTFEWFAREALALGYRVGFVANSDGHKADPGASYPGTSKFGAMGGLTCVLAERLDRESVVAALRARHFYATTGCRCLMDVSLQSGGKHWMMGDLAELQSSNPVLNVRLAGSAPIERVDVFNGLDLVQTLRPFTQTDLGRRIKLSWVGSKVRGRDRAVNWDGSLKVSGNRIEDAVAVNFWNPDQPLRRLDGDGLTWKSFTTGAQRGVIMTLEDALNGRMDIETACIKTSVEIAEIGMEGCTWDCGGLDVALRAFRLPDRQESNQFAFELPLSGLKQGDNPVFVRMAQEDGYLAWSSPIYVLIK